MPNNPYGQQPPGQQPPGQPPPGPPPGGQYPPGPPPGGAPQSPYAPPGYPAQPQGYGQPAYAASGLKPHRAGAVLALGICGLVVCGICGIIAWVMGNQDIAEMNAGTMDPSGYSSTNAGRICGIISSILMIVAVVFVIIAFAAGAAVESSGSFFILPW